MNNIFQYVNFCFSVASSETDPDEHASDGGWHCPLHDDTVRPDPRVTQHQDGAW